jgi:hypothetical protein
MGSIRSVVIDEFDIIRTSVLPHEADPPLVIDPDAVLTSPVTFESFKPIAGRDSEVFEISRGMQ